MVLVHYHLLQIPQLALKNSLTPQGYNQRHAQCALRRRKSRSVIKYEYITESSNLSRQIYEGNAFKRLIASAAGSSNGRTTDSESVYLGSNPNPAALVVSKYGGMK